MPTYSTVLSAVWPHVVSDSTPPSGVDALRKIAYASRGPMKNALKPVAQEPDVYMPPLPEAAVDAAGATPLLPASATTRVSPPPARHTGSVGDGVLVGDDDEESVGGGVLVADGVMDGERVADAD